MAGTQANEPNQPLVLSDDNDAETHLVDTHPPEDGVLRGTLITDDRDWLPSAHDRITNRKRFTPTYMHQTIDDVANFLIGPLTTCNGKRSAPQSGSTILRLMKFREDSWAYWKPEMDELGASFGFCFKEHMSALSAAGKERGECKAARANEILSDDRRLVEAPNRQTTPDIARLGMLTLKVWVMRCRVVKKQERQRELRGDFPNMVDYILPRLEDADQKVKFLADEIDKTHAQALRLQAMFPSTDLGRKFETLIAGLQSEIVATHATPEFVAAREYRCLEESIEILSGWGQYILHYSTLSLSDQKKLKSSSNEELANYPNWHIKLLGSPADFVNILQTQNLQNINLAHYHTGQTLFHTEHQRKWYKEIARNNAKRAFVDDADLQEALYEQMRVERDWSGHLCTRFEYLHKVKRYCLELEAQDLALAPTLVVPPFVAAAED